MICYRDKTFCVNPNCTCGNKLTKEVLKQANEWWHSWSIEGAPPIAYNDRCGDLTEEQIHEEFNKLVKE